MNSCRVPGKLFIAGEYAVLEPGYPAILAALDRTIIVTAFEADTTDCTTVRSGHLGERILCCAHIGGQVFLVNAEQVACGAFAYVWSALAMVQRLISERGLRMRAMELTIAGNLDAADGRKFGLGSSAAVTVAMIAALDAFHHLGLSMMDRYRLAMLATIAVSPHASGGDVAASTWGGWMAYRARDRRAVAGSAAERGMAVCLANDWPGLSVKSLSEPTGLTRQVGWTGQSASTPDLIIGGPGTDWRGQHYYADFLERSSDCVQCLQSALEIDDTAGIQGGIRRARAVLGDLDSAACLGIFTAPRRALCVAADAVGVPARPSGAGGGDWGMALVPRRAEQTIAELNRRWAGVGIETLPVRAHLSERTTR